MYKTSHIFVKAVHELFEAEQEENVYGIIFIISLQIIMPNLCVYIIIINLICFQ
jgi:hypothetical protein